MNFLFFAFHLPRLNLHAQIALVLLLSIGVLLATVPQLPASYPMSLKDLPVAIVLLHSFVGALAWLMAFHVIPVAGRPLIPRRLCFSNYRRGMCTAFVLWWAAFLLGGLVHYQLNVHP